MKRISELILRPISKLLFMLLVSFSFLLFCSSISLGRVEPIIPYLCDHAVLGLAVEDEHETFTPYLWDGYDLDYEEQVYKVGGRIDLNLNQTRKRTQTYFDLNYGYWPSHEVAGYPFQHGLAGSLQWKDADAGGLLQISEAPGDFKFHHSVGVGLLLELGRSDLRLEGVVTDEGHQRVLFHMDTFFPVQAGF